MWAWSDLSLGNTLLHTLHRMSLLILVPSTIKFVIASALGRPRFKSRPKSGDPVFDEESEDAGLKSIARAPSPQFQGYMDESLIGGLVGVRDNEDGLSITILSLLGDWKSVAADII